MSKYLLGASAAALVVIGTSVAPAQAAQRGVVNQSNLSGSAKNVHANNIRLCNNRCTISGDYAGNIVGIGNQNLGPTVVKAGKPSGSHPGKGKGHGNGHHMP